MNFNGERVDTGEDYLAFCCEPLGVAASAVNITSVNLGCKTEDSLLNYVNIRSRIINESKLFSLFKDSIPEYFRKYTTVCSKCHKFQLDNYENDNLIHTVNINMFFAPCQCKCIYCSQHTLEKDVLDKRLNINNFNKVKEAIEYALNNNMIAEDAVWQVASGEITIHPLKNEILNFIGNRTARFLTNGFIYNERIAENLKNNPKSEINLSIDAGTPETWYKVKGVNNFNIVIDNLIKYHEKSARTSSETGQITFKYIILPDINDNFNDFLGVINLMKKLKITNLCISRDSRFKYSNDDSLRERITKASANLSALLFKYNIKVEYFHYLSEEIIKINEYINSKYNNWKNMETYKNADEENYPEILKEYFYKMTNTKLDLKNPVTFNEKIQWLKLYDSTPIKTQLADKYLVREWIKYKIGEKYLIPILGIYDNFDDIDFNNLPDKFVIKATHGSGMNIIVKEKKQFDYLNAKHTIDDCLSTNYAYVQGLELHYRNMVPRIIIEQYIEDDDGQLNDYKFLCFNGEPKYIWVDTGRFTDHKRNIYDSNWNLSPFIICYPNDERIIPPPEKINEMINIVKILCKDFIFVRVDLYLIKNNIYFGEMTFTTGSGIEKIEPNEWNYNLGNMIKLSDNK